MNVHNRGYAAYPERNLEEHIRLSAQMGMKMIRFNFNPVSVSDYEYLDKAVQLCENYGIEMMLCLDGLLMYDTQAEFETYHGEIAQRYKGKIKYYQLFNEMDVYCMYLDNGDIYTGGNGDLIQQYNPERLQEVLPKLLGSIKGFRTNDPDAKLIVNFGWWHTAIIDYFMQNGARWDIIGWDWYSDAENISSISDVFDYLLSRYPTYDIIVCETNIWGYTQYTEEQQAEFVKQFMKTVYNYNSPKIKGLFFYELLDEPQFQPTSVYSGEAHFGFIKCDWYGNILEKKKAFYTIQQVLVGN